MLLESEERAAQLAVSRFGAEASKVQRLYQQAREAQSQGRGIDLLEILVQHNLLDGCPGARSASRPGRHPNRHHAATPPAPYGRSG